MPKSNPKVWSKYETNSRILEKRDLSAGHNKMIRGGYKRFKVSARWNSRFQRESTISHLILRETRGGKNRGEW